MKYLMLIIGITSVLFLSGQEVADNSPTLHTNAIEWVNTDFDCGKIDQNKPFHSNFIFKNISDKPVVIMEAKSTCSCTKTKFPEYPILPGQTGYISATYDASHIGPFSKTITVLTDSDDDPKILYLTGEVILRF